MQNHCLFNHIWDISWKLENVFNHVYIYKIWSKNLRFVWTIYDKAYVH